MTATLTSLRLHIEEQLVRGEQVTAVMGAEVENLIYSYLKLLSSGRITARTKDLGQMMVYIPVKQGAKIRWKCVGGPIEVMPPECR